MATLPNPTLDAIYASYVKRNDSRHSQRLGASVAGKKCERQIWYGFRHVMKEKFDGRKLRLFDTGHREELRLIEDLRAAGITVWDKDQNGNQFEYTALDGHLVDKIDGVVLGVPEAPQTPHLLEAKSSNKKNFDKLVKEGIEKAKPDHFVQCMIGMGLADLTRALYVVVCKDNDEVYVERIEYDDKEFKAILLRCKRIINAESPPDKISKDPSFFICKHLCSFSEICHGEQIPEANCRTCVHSAPGPNATWTCANNLPMEPGCGEHIYNPALLESWAEPTDGDPGFVRYRIKKNNREFVNCADTAFPAMDVSHYASRELANCSVDKIGDPVIESARKILDGEIIESKKGAA